MNGYVVSVFSSVLLLTGIAVETNAQNAAAEAQAHVGRSVTL